MSEQTHLPNHFGQYTSVGRSSAWWCDQTCSISEASLLPLFLLHQKVCENNMYKTMLWRNNKSIIGKVLRTDFELTFSPLDGLFSPIKLMLSADILIKQCYSVICTWTADYIKNNHLHLTTQPHCSVCNTPKLSFGKENSVPWQVRNYWLYFPKRILATLGDGMESKNARQYLADWVVGFSKDILRNIKYISQITIIIHHIHHTINLGMVQHMIDWVMSFLAQQSRIDKSNQCCTTIPLYSAFTRLIKL